MKKALSVVICLVILLGLSGCYYIPPEGWTRHHHTYEEVLAFAKSIDPKAAVSEEYTDTVDEYGWKYREWDAVIKGVRCHVASVSDWVWNYGFAAGEFIKVYYRIDTDYDYTIMQNILSEKYPGWSNREGIRSKYHYYNTIYVDLNLAEQRMLDEDELEQVWQEALSIYEEYRLLSVERETVFVIQAPEVYWDSGDETKIVKMHGHTYIEDISEEGKNSFIQEYQEAWALLDSGMPVYD